VLRESALAPEVKRHLRAQLRALPHSRLLFIRRPDRRDHPRLAVFHARSSERGAVVSGVEIDDYRELLDLDFTAGSATPLRHPLFVVCTHGKRDRCCAVEGRPLYQELCAQSDPGWVWQSTHVGGDRFAGNVVCLPEGLYFGRVGRLDVWPLLDDYLAGRIALAHYRGRSCYPFHVQAAERAVRTATGLTGLDELELVSADGRDGAWTVRFRAGGEDHEVEIAEELGELAYLTCDAAVPRRPRRYVATSQRVLAGP
jgi:hypothetical protein